jgi:hypothetical protein
MCATITAPRRVPRFGVFAVAIHLPLSKFEWVTWVTGRENEWVNGGRDVRRSEPLMRSLSQIRLRAWGRRSRAAHAPEPVRRRGLPRLGAGLGVGHRWPRTLKCSKNVQILTHSKFKRAIHFPLGISSLYLERGSRAKPNIKRKAVRAGNVEQREAALADCFSAIDRPGSVALSPNRLVVKVSVVCERPFD